MQLQLEIFKSMCCCKNVCSPIVNDVQKWVTLLSVIEKSISSYTFVQVETQNWQGLVGCYLASRDISQLFDLTKLLAVKEVMITW